MTETRIPRPQRAGRCKQTWGRAQEGGGPSLPPRKVPRGAYGWTVPGFPLLAPAPPVEWTRVRRWAAGPRAGRRWRFAWGGGGVRVRRGDPKLVAVVREMSGRQRGLAGCPGTAATRSWVAAVSVHGVKGSRGGELGRKAGFQVLRSPRTRFEARFPRTRAVWVISGRPLRGFGM